jgi:hypothetical protein
MWVSFAHFQHQTGFFVLTTSATVLCSVGGVTAGCGRKGLEPELGTELENYAYHKKVEKNSALETEFAEEWIKTCSSSPMEQQRSSNI